MKYAEESGRHQTAPTSCDYSGGANFDANSAFRDYLTKSYVIPKPSKLNGTSVSQASGCLSMPRNAPDPSQRHRCNDRDSSLERAQQQLAGRAEVTPKSRDQHVRVE